MMNFSEWNWQNVHEYAVYLGVYHPFDGSVVVVCLQKKTGTNVMK